MLSGRFQKAVVMLVHWLILVIRWLSFKLVNLRLVRWLKYFAIRTDFLGFTLHVFGFGVSTPASLTHIAVLMLSVVFCPVCLSFFSPWSWKYLLPVPLS